MSFDLMQKPSCSGCGSTSDLYGSNCKHLTLCSSCGKSMAQNRGKCYECGATLTRLIWEYNVRASSSNDRNYFIGRFATGLPNFSKKKSAENQWSLQKEGLQGRQVTDALKEKFKNRPWLLEDETGQSQYHGQLEGSQSATYYLLMLQGKEFVAIPAGSWYNFSKVAQYRQLTLEEAEEKMKNWRKTVDGYERWMMKTAKDGAAAFGVNPDLIKDAPAAAAGGKGRKKSSDGEESNVSDKGEEDPDEEASRKSRLGLNKKGSEDEDDEGRRGGDFDDDDDNIEKGDDWEHEDIFTDDDEAVGNDPEEREDLLAPEVPAPPDIKQDDDEEEEGDEEEGGLSKSGKDLKKLLGRASGLKDSNGDEEDDGKRKKEEDDDDDNEDEDRRYPVLAPKLKGPKEEPADNSPAKPVLGGSSRGTPTSKSAKGKRKNGDDTKPAASAGSKKIKTQTDVKPTIKEEPSKGEGASKGTPPSSRPAAAGQGPVSEDEIRAVLLQRAPLTTSELVGKFKARMKSPEDKKAFADILKRISKIQKNNNLNYVILRSK